MTQQINSPVFGVDVERADDDREFDLGTYVEAPDGKGYIYGQADGAIDASALCLIPEDHDCPEATTTNTASAFGTRCGVAVVDLADGQYGWFQRRGPGTVLAAASCAANVAINSTGTGGTLDDDATAGAEVIDGVVLTSAAAGGGGATACMLTDPVVGETL